MSAVLVASTTDPVAPAGGALLDTAVPAVPAVAPAGFTLCASTSDADRPRSQTNSAACDPSRTTTTVVITIFLGLRDSSDPIVSVHHVPARSGAYFV